MRNFDWHVGHWTTTVVLSRAGRLPDKELSQQNRAARGALTHTVACGRMAPAALRVTSKDCGVSAMSEHEHGPAAEAGRDASTAGKKKPKVIKRYTNRKLYDTVESRYVNPHEIAPNIQGAPRSKSVNNPSKEHPTPRTLTPTNL